MTISLPRVLRPFYCVDLVRVGNDNDGGYLVNYPDILKSDFLLSFGVGDNITFEEQFCSIKDVPLHAYDASVEGAFASDNHQHFQKYVGLADTDTEASIYTILSTAPDNTFLKCDIENGEYPILDAIITYSHKLTGAVFEFHDLTNPVKFGMLMDFMSKLNMRLVHTHINNYGNVHTTNGIVPTVLELTFTSSNNVNLQNIELPHRLDSPNNPSAQDELLQFV